MAWPHAPRLQHVQPPATIAAGERARELARQGNDIIDLGQSSPYHRTPAHIVEAGVKALQDGHTNIESPRGLPAFRAAMAQKLAQHNGLDVDPEHDVLAVPGSKQGLYYAINAYVGPGDEILLLEPTWVSYRQQVELAQGVPVAVALDEGEAYTLSEERLRQHVTPRTKALLINNPNNPTGRVYTLQELEGVARVAQEHDLLVVCDETYEYFVYDAHQHHTLAALPGMWPRTLTSFTFTKAYAMAGWRLGCMVGPASLLAPLVQIHAHTASFVSPFVQIAGIAALNGPQDHLEAWRQSCEGLRHQIVDCLRRIPGVSCPLPEGATFVFPRYTAPYASQELARRLVEHQGVVVTPGVGFGEAGEGHVRIALMRSPAERVIAGVEHIAPALAT
ncbi:MAG: aminotransferase class I/II-fold pyridoxal phosphate-dependent enzyme [Candidatus Tectomicrobia bacterium]